MRISTSFSLLLLIVTTVSKTGNAWIVVGSNKNKNNNNVVGIHRQTLRLLSSSSLYSSTSSSTTTETTEATVNDDNDKGNNNNNIQINPLLLQIQPSKTVEIFGQVKQMENDGINVTSLCVGEPDFPPFPAIIQATKDALLDAKNTKYTAVTGTIELRTAICDDLYKRKHVKYNPLTDIVVSNGAKQAVYQSLLSIIGINDKVIIPAPYWPSYPEQVLLCNGIPIIINTTIHDNYILSGKQLRTALQENDNVKCIILCNPSNPTGSVYTKEQLQDLVNVLKDYPNIVVLADEIYEQLIYDNIEHISIASLLPKQTIVINGFSKSYSMTGYRLGYSATSIPNISKYISTIQSQFTSCASSIAQYAALAALQQVTVDEMNETIQIMQTKRDYVMKQLQTIPNIILPTIKPQGAFYILPDVSYYCGDDDIEFCKQLLNDEKLALVPGTSFGAPGTIRISYATSMIELEIAMKKLISFCNNNKHK